MAYLCLKCQNEIDPHDHRLKDNLHPNFGGCPHCGSPGVPADMSKKLTVAITWHELRILTIWAERWASQAEPDSPGSQAIIYGIADRIQMQHMDQKVGLTFASELAELREFLGKTGGKLLHQTVIREDDDGDPSRP